MDNITNVLIAAVISAINKTTFSKASDLTKTDLDELFRLAQMHQLTAIVNYALKSVGIQDSRFEMEQANALWVLATLEYERKAIFEEFGKNGIWYMPLKGAVLKDYYPLPVMRQMSDNDILFDASRADDVKMIMESLGFTSVYFDTGHQDDYQKAPVSHFEMHRMLFSKNARGQLYDYYRNIDEKLIRLDGYERRFTNEDFYIYMIAHEFKHFYGGGTGIRSLLDVYVFLNRFNESVDWNYIDKELKQLRIEGFEKKNRDLALAVFSGKSLDLLSAEQDEMLDYFMTSGVYGTRERAFKSKVNKGVSEHGRIGFVLQRIFLPLTSIEKGYPFFYKHKILIPFLPIVRLFNGWANALDEIKQLWNRN